MLKKIAKIFLVIFLALLLLIGGLTGYVWYNEQKIMAFLLQSINEKVDTKISTSRVDISFIRSFPDIGLSFNNLRIESAKTYTSAHPYAPKLLKAEKLQVYFNFFDVLHRNFKVRGIKISNGALNIFTDKNGRSNYNFWKESKSDSSSNLNFSLEKILIQNITLNYIDKKIKIQTFISESSTIGRIGLSSANCKINLTFSKTQYDTLLIKPEVKLKSLINMKNNELIIEYLALEVENMEIDIKAKLIGDKYSMNFDTGNLDFYKLRPYISKYFKNFDIQSALLSLNGNIKGNIKQKNLLANVDIKVSDGLCLFNNHNINKISGKFSFSWQNGFSFLKSDDLNFYINNSDFNTKFNLTRKTFFANIKSKIYVTDFSSLINNEIYKLNDGYISINADIENRYSSFEKFDIKTLEYSGDANINNLSFEMYENAYKIHDLNCHLNFSSNAITISDLIANLNGTNLKSSFIIENKQGFSSSNNFLEIKGELYCDTIFVDKFPLIGSGDSSSFTLNGELVLKSKFLAFKKFFAEETSTLLKFSDSKYEFNDLNLKLFNGKIVNSKVQVNFNNKLYINSKINVNNIDIQKLFKAFDNFGQTQILAENIKGKLSGNLESNIAFNTKMEFLPEMFKGTFAISINDGSLINYKPIEKLSTFLEIEDLRNIQFESIKNNFSISDQNLLIPEMTIKSSALDLNISGKHNFSNEYEYHFSLKISDLLFGKMKKKRKDFELEDMENTGSRLYVKLNGKDENYKISYDSRKAMNAFSTSMSQEKSKLKNILTEEFFGKKIDSLETKKSVQKLIIDNELEKGKPEKVVRNKNSTKIIWTDEN